MTLSPHPDAERHRAALQRDRARLENVLADHRRRQLAYGLDPLDLPDLRRDAIAPSMYAIAMDLLDGRCGCELRERGECALILESKLGTGGGGLWLDVHQLQDDAARLKRRLAAAPERTQAGHRPSLLALFMHPRPGTRGDTLRTIAGHLLSTGCRPGVALGLLEAWDAQQNRPPLGRLEVERILRWTARKQAEQIEGAA